MNKWLYNLIKLTLYNENKEIKYYFINALINVIAQVLVTFKYYWKKDNFLNDI